MFLQQLLPFCAMAHISPNFCNHVTVRRYSATGIGAMLILDPHIIGATSHPFDRAGDVERTVDLHAPVRTLDKVRIMLISRLYGTTA